jgi:GNAT superfamily N-acetyltransferase
VEAVEIRPASFPEDTASLLAIDASFLASEMLAVDIADGGFRMNRVPLPSPVQKTFPLTDLARDWDVALLATTMGQAVAIACAALATWNNRLIVSHFYVDARWRGQGVGTRLMNELIARGRTLSADHLWVETSNLNLRAIDAYRHWGFALCGLDSALYRGTPAHAEVAVFLCHPL